jgi:hypothetical protein
MKSFKIFLRESKIEDFTNRYSKIFKDHPLVNENPEEAKKLFTHTHGLGLGHHESVFAIRSFLDKTLKPNEDEFSIRQTINKWNKAKKEGRVTGEISNHTFETVRSALKKTEKPDTDPEKVPRSISPGLKNYHIGTIEHPEHGSLNVYHISHKQIGDNNDEYSRLSSELKKHACKDNTHCVSGDYGAEHLNTYSRGHGFLLYTGKNNKTIFGHGFGDRGIVDPANDVVSPEEHKFLSSKTHALLPESHKEIYHFINSDQKDFSLEKQEKMYNEFGDVAGAYFADHKKNTHPKILTKLLDHKNSNVVVASLYHPNATQENIIKALNNKSGYLRGEVIRHPKATPEHINKALDDVFEDIRVSAIRHPNATQENITKALNDKSNYVRDTATRHPNVTPEHITKALADPHWSVRAGAIRHPNVTPEHINKALADKSEYVRDTAIRHPNVTPEHINKALADKSVNVRWQAIEHPNATPEHISKALVDRHSSVRQRAVGHPNATLEHITKALDDESELVRGTAVGHPNATLEHITKALNDESRYVLDIAENRLKRRTQ